MRDLSVGTIQIPGGTEGGTKGIHRLLMEVRKGALRSPSKLLVLSKLR